MVGSYTPPLGQKLRRGCRSKAMRSRHLRISSADGGAHPFPPLGALRRPRFGGSSQPRKSAPGTTSCGKFARSAGPSCTAPPPPRTTTSSAAPPDGQSERATPSTALTPLKQLALRALRKRLLLPTDPHGPAPHRRVHFDLAQF